MQDLAQLVGIIRRMKLQPEIPYEDQVEILKRFKKEKSKNLAHVLFGNKKPTKTEKIITESLKILAFGKQV